MFGTEKRRAIRCRSAYSLRSRWPCSVGKAIACSIATFPNRGLPCYSPCALVIVHFANVKGYAAYLLAKRIFDGKEQATRVAHFEDFEELL